MKYSIKLSLTIQTPEVVKKIPVSLLEGSLEEKFSKAEKLGVDGLEFLIVDPEMLDHNEIKYGLKKHNLNAAAISTGAIAYSKGLSLLDPDNEVSLKSQKLLHSIIEFSAKVGAPMVTIGSFRGKAVSSHKKTQDFLIGILKEAAKKALCNNVKIVIEPLNRYETNVLNNAEQTLNFIYSLGCSNVGILLDTYHMNIEESSMTEPFVRIMKEDLLWHIHLGDNNRFSTGSGFIDFKSIVETLVRIKYKKYLSAELLNYPNADSAAADTINYMKSLLEVIK